jgi:hypothetical protein
MGFERVEEGEFELAEQCLITVKLFEYRVDEYGFVRRLVGEQVGVGRRLRIDELAKNHVASCTWAHHSFYVGAVIMAL